MRPGYRCVIGNGETIMQIVPGADQLVVEAKVAPNDIAQVAPGAKVIVRIMAGNQRTQPEITGVLNRVSADLAREPQQQNSAQPPRPITPFACPPTIRGGPEHDERALL